MHLICIFVQNLIIRKYLEGILILLHGISKPKTIYKSCLDNIFDNTNSIKDKYIPIIISKSILDHFSTIQQMVFKNAPKKVSYKNKKSHNYLDSPANISTYEIIKKEYNHKKVKR